MTQQFNINQFTWNKQNKVLSVEASEIDVHLDKYYLYSGIGITNTTTGGYRKFSFTHVDTDGEDIFGWNFESPDGIKLLIIND